MEFHGISREEMAKRMGLPSDVLDELIAGDRAFTAEVALALQETLPGTQAKFWLNLDANYQMTKVLIVERDREQAGTATPEPPAGILAPDAPAVAAPDAGS
jgi:addiction module HigA family antidote